MNTDTVSFPFPTKTHRPDLDELAHRETVPALWTDKRSPRKTGEFYVCHDYLRIYERIFSPLRDEPIRLLEIGLNVGASIKLWLQYFTQAKIFGVDIADFKFAPEIEKFVVEQGLLNRFEFSKGDAFDVNFWNFYKENKPEGLDVIIDDGSHASGPIATAFACMWGMVNPGGYYIIEDIGEVKNRQSHTPGYLDQLQYATSMVGNILMGTSLDIDEAFVSKELLILKKK